MAPSPLATYKNAPDSRDMASLITAASLINGDLSEHKTLVTILPQDNDWDNIATITGDTSWGINFDETGDRPKATGVEHLVGKSLHRADPRATKEESGIPGHLLGVGGNMRDRHEIGITGTGGLKGGYTANGIAFGYFKHSSVAENGDPRLFLGGVRACFNGYFPNYAEHALADLSVWTWLTSRVTAATTPTCLFESASGEEDLQALYEGIKYGIEALENLISLDGAIGRIWPPKEIASEA
ncbi:gmc oxidoreductase [Colletotrichum incanum]|uniref:Gmc oxidoreductase n=1 Tax=Colletotrichum incanum TaxID=1573173 RepID=A0A162N6R6_COLIC|nr:gmc oxidoreductase [Colletotrichum incanum]